MAQQRVTASQEPAGGGWIVFSGTFLALVGMFNIIWSIAAFSSDSHFRRADLLFGNLTMWAWILLIVGLMQIAAAFGIFAGKGMAQVIAILLAMVNATVQLLSVGAYPIWSITVFALDCLVIYGLTVYGERWADS
jgi:hypothetical protein